MTEEDFEALVALDDEGVEAHEVRRLLGEALLRGGELQHLGDVAQIAPLVRRQHLSDRSPLKLVHLVPNKPS